MWQKLAVRNNRNEEQKSNKDRMKIITGFYAGIAAEVNKFRESRQE